ncbi:hypothetical protein [Litoreibacter meonggei]|uniref:hypothetical protein n=1 Tax=Litoreibacter meonggei TaxID=1049199 RepID=UPI001472F40A|nr:hypothetical protein [Litoreibacter meonggei]
MEIDSRRFSRTCLVPDSSRLLDGLGQWQFSGLRSFVVAVSALYGVFHIVSDRNNRASDSNGDQRTVFQGQASRIRMALRSYDHFDCGTFGSSDDRRCGGGVLPVIPLHNNSTVHPVLYEKRKGTAYV